MDKLRQIFNNLTERLSEFVGKLTTLEVKTFRSIMDAKDPKLDDKLRNCLPN